jgi:hypothetical protein
MNLGAFSISLAVKDLEASRSFHEKSNAPVGRCFRMSLR